jgi:hypothetical protein
MGIGQHRSSPGPAVNSGQRNVRGTAGDVGMEGGGERQNGPVPGSRPINSGVPIHGEAENDFGRANRHGKR